MIHVGPSCERRGLLSRVVLRVARRAGSARGLEVARAVAGQDRVSNAAVYYIALRYLRHETNAVPIAMRAGMRARLDGAEAIQPFLELYEVAKGERVPTALALLDACLADLEDSHRAAGPAGDQLAQALRYARAMLRGDFVEAFERWAALPSTIAARESKGSIERAHGPAGWRHWAADASVAVVLPGASDPAFHDEILGHDLVARTALPARRATDDRGLRTDVLFLNRDRFLGLAKAPPVGPLPVVVTKSGVAGRARNHERALDVEFSLPEVAPGVAGYTYLTVPIAAWVLARFTRPASFYFADFYLGRQAYEDTSYDDKKHLDSANDIRLSYLTHDVFFVHAVLRRWAERDRIRAPGRLGEILSWDAATFAQRVEERWGRHGGSERRSASGS